MPTPQRFAQSRMNKYIIKTRLMQPDNLQVGLFGLNHSNRDFSQRESWGKNQFNNSFPASLACYMYQQGLPGFLTKSSNPYKNGVLGFHIA